MTGGPADGVQALTAALGALGVSCRVEARGRLAVIHSDARGLSRLGDERVRVATVAHARDCGFTHVAIELSASLPADAPVLRH